MKTIKIYLLCIIAITASAFAKPSHHMKPNYRHSPIVHHHSVPPRPAYGPRLPPPPPPKHYHYHHNNFLPGFIGGLLGSVLVNQPTIIVQPMKATVWVEGRYVDQVQPNGVIIRVWQPGHYETIVR